MIWSNFRADCMVWIGHSLFVKWLIHRLFCMVVVWRARRYSGKFWIPSDKKGVHSQVLLARGSAMVTWHVTQSLLNIVTPLNWPHTEEMKKKCNLFDMSVWLRSCGCGRSNHAHFNSQKSSVPSMEQHHTLWYPLFDFDPHREQKVYSCPVPRKHLLSIFWLSKSKASCLMGIVSITLEGHPEI
jgi:hypothetical protein